MKILLLGGFLGSGKTSVLLPLAKYMTEHSTYTGTRVAIIENEIGDVSIDGITLRNAGLSVQELFSGCICCTLGAELIGGLMQIEREQNPEWVIIEATGVACPGNVADNIRQYIKNCTQSHVVVVSDAERLTRLLRAITHIAPQQIRDAEVLLINKIDLVDEATLIEAEATLREYNETAPIFRICAKDGIDEAVFAAIIGGNENA
ncbi:MAG: cobalamin biosynthesis protein P47K [Oscillospiraceae bacterium]|nr:cobalamin biosynthesis protein P47K [Oscillospiraceae bacterium]